MRLIPAIDLIDGKCVRLTQGDYQQKTIYSENPLDLAKRFEAHGFQHLHLVDLDGAKSNTIINWKTLEAIATQTQLKIDFGGGIKNNEAIQLAFNCGASQVTVGSIAVKDETLTTQWLQTYGSDKIILGADVKHRQIAVSGWQEQTELQLNDFIANYQRKGILNVICTDITRDGRLQGSALQLYQELRRDFPTLQFIASGGVTSLPELHTLHTLGLHGTIIGKALYEGHLTLHDCTQFILNTPKNVQLKTQKGPN